MRKKQGFDGSIYIQVTSYFSSSYYLEVLINDKPFVVLENQIMQLIKLEGGSVTNLIYEDENYVKDVPADGKLRYKTKIEMLEGAVQLGLRDCDSLMKSNLVSGCLIKNLDELKNPNIKKTFDNI